MNKKIRHVIPVIFSIIISLFLSMQTPILADNYTPNDNNIITKVEMSHANGQTSTDNNHWESWETVTLTYDFDFGYPSKIESGDTFTFSLPDSFKTYSSSPVQNNLYARDENGDLVLLAVVTIYPNNTVVMNFTDDNNYINSHDDISGSFSINVYFSESYEGEKIIFDNSTEIEIEYTPSKPSTPHEPTTEQNNLLKSSKLVDFDQRIMLWTLKISFSEDVKDSYVLDQMRDGTHVFERYYDGIDPELLDTSNNSSNLKWNKIPGWSEEDWHRNVVRVRYNVGVVDQNGDPVYDNSGKQLVKNEFKFIEIEPILENESGQITAMKIPLGDIENIKGHDTDVMIDYYTRAIDLSQDTYYNNANFISDSLEFKQTGVVNILSFSGGATGSIHRISIQKTNELGHIIPSSQVKFNLDKLDTQNNIIYSTGIQLKEGIANVSLSKGNYRLSEISAPNGYDLLKEDYYFTVDSNTSTDVNIPTIHSIMNTKSDTTKLVINKVWEDNLSHTGNDEYIEVVIYQVSENSSSVYMQRKVFAKDGWTLELTNLPIINSKGERVSYEVDEINVGPDYNVSVDRNHENIVITNTGEVQNISVIKEWEDQNNKDGIRPESIIVQLLKDKTPYGEVVVLSDANNWSYEWKDVATYIDGKEIVYTIQEITKVDGYTVNVTSTKKDNQISFILTNVYHPAKINIQGTKTWIDSEDALKLRPKFIEVELYALDEKIDTIQVTEDMNWKYEFNGLDKYKNGEVIAYSIREVSVDNYTTKVEGYNLVNTITPSSEIPPEPNTPDEPSKPDKPTDKLPSTGVNDKVLTIATYLVSMGGLLLIMVKKVKETSLD